MSITDDVKHSCPYCSYEATVKEFGTWEKDGKRGILGKTKEGYLVFMCPKCFKEILYSIKANLLFSPGTAEARGFGYMEKHEKHVGWKYIDDLITEYINHDMDFLPLVDKVGINNMEILFNEIDKSDKLTPKEKVDSIFAFICIFGGVKPEEKYMVHLNSVIGKENMKDIMESMNENIKYKNISNKLKKWSTIYALMTILGIIGNFIGLSIDNSSFLTLFPSIMFIIGILGFIITRILIWWRNR